MMNSNYSVVMMCTANTVKNLKNNYKYINEYLKPKSVVVVANKKVKELIDRECPCAEFIDEDLLYPQMNLKRIKDLMSTRIDECVASKRAGWYFQQFLKMAYCTICQETEYLIWDSDTVPTRCVEFHSKSGKKIFDVKTEYHKPYFDTLSILFPMLKKTNNYSFISEHMLIDKKIMYELMSKIEENIDIEGNSFWEKIINAVEPRVLGESGFSEFETYGTYVEYFHKEEYEVREWKSLREGTIFFGKGIDDKVLAYLSKEYDAVSFEQHSIHLKLQKVLSHRIFQNLFVINVFESIKKFLAER